MKLNFFSTSSRPPLREYKTRSQLEEISSSDTSVSSLWSQSQPSLPPLQWLIDSMDFLSVVHLNWQYFHHPRIRMARVNVLKLASVRIVIKYLLFIQTQVTCLPCPSRCCIYLIHTAFLFNVLHWIASGFSTSDGRWWLVYCTSYIVHPLTSGLPSKLRGISESKGSINGYVCN